MTTNSVISANAISVHIDQRTILDNLNFEVGKGEVFALLGGNGAGKSTTLKTFLGLMKPSTGSASVMGLSVAEHTNEKSGKVTGPSVKAMTISIYIYYSFRFIH